MLISFVCADHGPLRARVFPSIALSICLERATAIDACLLLPKEAFSSHSCLYSQAAGDLHPTSPCAFGTRSRGVRMPPDNAVAGPTQGPRARLLPGYLVGKVRKTNGLPLPAYRAATAVYGGVDADELSPFYCFFCQWWKQLASRHCFCHCCGSATVLSWYKKLARSAVGRRWLGSCVGRRGGHFALLPPTGKIWRHPYRRSGPAG